MLSYDANRFYRILISNSKVERYFNINWINNLPPKPILIELNLIMITRVNKEESSAYVNKRRLDALDNHLPNYANYFDDEISVISFSGEKSVKRRRETFVKVVNNFIFKLKPSV